MTIYKVLDETFVSRSDATRKLVYREKYFIPNGITRGYLKMGHMIVYCGNNKWNVVERGYSIPEINKMVVVGNVEYKELTAAVAKVVLEKAEAQTGEVAPVVHGHWVYKRRRSGGFRIRTGLLKNWERVKVLIDEREDTMEPFCSVCGAHNDSTNDQNMRYCPCCGAKMDGEAQDEKPQG